MKKIPLLNGPGKIQFSKFVLFREHQKLTKYKFSWKNLKNWNFPGQKSRPPPAMALTVYILIGENEKNYNPAYTVSAIAGGGLTFY